MEQSRTIARWESKSGLHGVSLDESSVDWSVEWGNGNVHSLAKIPIFSGSRIFAFKNDAEAIAYVEEHYIKVSKVKLRRVE